MAILDFMKKTWDQHAGKTVKLICLPLPPTPVGDVIYMPDCFTSNTYDKEFNRSPDFNAISMHPTPLGPAILAYIKLHKLISYDQQTGFLTVNVSTCCASISAYVGVRSDSGLIYVDECKIDNLRMIGRSCHPGSHYVVPKAPFLTSLLQYAQAGDRTLTIEYMHPSEGERVFPHVDWSTNRGLDEYLGKCVVAPRVSYFRARGGLGAWTQPYLRQMRVNLLLKENRNAPVKRGHEVPGNAGQEDDGSNGGSALTRGTQRVVQA